VSGMSSACWRLSDHLDMSRWSGDVANKSARKLRGNWSQWNLSLTPSRHQSAVQCLCECVQAELEEQVNMVKVAEDHAKKASADASRLAEELRQEQDHSTQIEKARRTAETIAKDLQTRLDEAEAAAMQGGRKIVQKMEQVCATFSTV